MVNGALNVLVISKPYVSFVLDKMSVPTILSIALKNNTEKVMKNIMISFSSDSGTMEDAVFHISEMEPQGEIAIEPETRLADAKLINTTEMYEETVRIAVSIDGEDVGQEVCTVTIATNEDDMHDARSFDLDVLPFDQWVVEAPESIACFVTPNHPSINTVLLKAASVLKRWGKSVALEGYQADDPERVRLMAAAVFQAIREEGIVYSNPPASYVGLGQRIRPAGDVLTDHMGTCIDMAVLYASCLEAIGLNPFVVLVEGHAFAGAWLHERTFTEVIEPDPSQLVNRLSEGINELFVAECTCLCNDKTESFDQACELGRKNLLLEGEYQAAIDIVRARRAGLLPLPQRIRSDAGWQLVVPEVNSEIDGSAPASRTVSTAYIDPTVQSTFTKKDVWERSLLDLTLRNNLLNMRVGTKLMPLAAASLDDLEDALADGKSLSVLPKPQEWGKIELAFELLNSMKEIQSFLQSEFNQKRLRTYYTEKELTKAITGLYRASKQALDETGANTLYMSFGVLRWFREGDPNPHYAPLVLIPVEIIRKSAKQGYALAIRDEDPQINVSLLEMLRRDFGIDIGGLDPLPQDDHGIDTRLIFNTFQHRILDQTQWEVLEVACLGIFSFSQFIMWDDIHSHEAELRKSPIVSSLLEGHLTWAAEPMEMPERVEQEDALLTVEADASQLWAIKEAAHDKSFVLHGPPGTGKSQVITGLIANALMHDKRVLFVSEKSAALEVVERRLDALGIGKLCLELHSDKANKAHVLDQLQQASELNFSVSGTTYEEQRQTVLQLKKELDEYADALYEKNEAGITLREQICHYERMRDQARFDLPIPSDYIATIKGITGLEDDVRMIERLAIATQGMDDFESHPLRQVKGSEYDPTQMSRIRQYAESASRSLLEAEELIRGLCDEIDQPVPQTQERLNALSQDLSNALQIGVLPKAWIENGSTALLLEDLALLVRESSSLGSVRSDNEKWSEAFFKLDPDALELEWIEAKQSGFLKRKKATGAFFSKISTYSRTAISEEEIPQALAFLRDVKAQEAQFDLHVKNAEKLLTEFKTIDGYDWERVKKSVETVQEMLSSGSLSNASFMKIKLALDNREELKDMACSFVSKYDQGTKAFSSLSDLVGGIKIAPDESWILNAIQVSEALLDPMCSLQEWMRWRGIAQALENKNLGCVVEALMDGVPASELASAFERSLYKAMCERSLSNRRVATSFSGPLFEEEIRQYSKASEKLLELAKQELVLHLVSRVPNLTLASQRDSEASILSRAIKSKGRGVSIRSLFSSIPTLIKGLAPCMLMSPMSVAQYLDYSNEPFDLVVFDEASQLQTCKAVGALARAKNAIVVGDPKQMPPTSFFSSAIDDSELGDIADMESILDDCLAINMPETHLQWHYRSQHESLISFSNAQFYESKMCTFPSVDDAESRVQLVYVPGYYEGAGKNTFEAKAVVAELRRRFIEMPDEASIGVITFNIKQQNLIQDLLEEAFLEDPEFERWALSGEEPLFVKNLENVQGDERDVILFSVTYAPDENGRLLMRFGPINNEGGWRRLNVAITRSRKEMKVFSTLMPDEMDSKKITSKGVRALKSFLEFARNGRFIGTGALTTDPSDHIVSKVSEKLMEAGYEIKRNVGSSSYRVDIAVLMPSDKSNQEDKQQARTKEYLAGLLFDGASYGRARTTRDREVSRNKVLRSLGWNTYRIWALDWLSDQEKTIQKLLTFLEEQVAIRMANDAVAESVSFAEEDRLSMNEGRQSSVLVSVSNGVFQTELEGDTDEFQQSESSGVQGSSSSGSELEEAVAEEDRKATDEFHGESTNRDVAQNESAQNLPILVRYEHAALEQGPLLEADEYINDHDDDIRSRMVYLIEHEAPIEMTRMFNRVRDSFGIARSGKNIQAKNEQILKSIRHKKTKRGDEIFIWDSEQDPKTYSLAREISVEENDKPAITEICDEEIINMFVLVIASQGAQSKENLIRLTANRFGFKRVASRMQQLLSGVITKAKRRKQLYEDNGLIMIPDE